MTVYGIELYLCQTSPSYLPYSQSVALLLNIFTSHTNKNNKPKDKTNNSAERKLLRNDGHFMARMVVMVLWTDTVPHSLVVQIKHVPLLTCQSHLSEAVER